MNTLTPFGRFLRMLRLDRTETLKDMTVQLANSANYTISPAFLSAVELGRKAVSGELVDAVVSTYKLDGPAQQKLRTAAEDSAAVFKLRPSPEKRQLVTQFARRFEELDSNEVKKILSILKSDRPRDSKT